MQNISISTVALMTDSVTFRGTLDSRLKLNVVWCTVSGGRPGVPDDVISL